jgi:hypothetical protein
MTKRKYTHTRTDCSRVRQTYNQDGGWIVKIFYCTIERLAYIGREGKSKVKIFNIKKKQELFKIYFLNSYSRGDFVL